MGLYHPPFVVCVILSAFNGAIVRSNSSPDGVHSWHIYERRKSAKGSYMLLDWFAGAGVRVYGREGGNKRFLSVDSRGYVAKVRFLFARGWMDGVMRSQYSHRL